MHFIMLLILLCVFNSILLYILLWKIVTSYQNKCLTQSACIEIDDRQTYLQMMEFLACLRNIIYFMARMCTTLFLECAVNTLVTMMLFHHNLNLDAGIKVIVIAHDNNKLSASSNYSSLSVWDVVLFIKWWKMTKSNHGASAEDTDMLLFLDDFFSILRQLMKKASPFSWVVTLGSTGFMGADVADVWGVIANVCGVSVSLWAITAAMWYFTVTVWDAAFTAWGISISRWATQQFHCLL